MSVTTFDETLTLLTFGLSQRSHPSTIILQNARASVENYLETLQHAFIESADRSPPHPDLDTLRENGVPTVSDTEFTTALEDIDKRRRTLLGLVESDEREWPSPDEE